MPARPRKPAAPTGTVRLDARNLTSVIHASGLVTFEVEGPRADRLTSELEKAAGVEMAAPFGQTLHVSGTNRKALEAAIQPYRRDPYRWTEVEPSLEDAYLVLVPQVTGDDTSWAA